MGGHDEGKNEKLKKFQYSWHPRPLKNFFRHHKTRQLIMLHITRDESRRQTFWEVEDSGATIKEWETITLWTLGTSTKIWEDLILEAKSEFLKTAEGKTMIYRYRNKGNLWTPHGGKPKDIRPWKTIVTQNNIKENILNDIKLFMDSEKEYKNRGTPYRRGYLLHGPPGTGKSSLVYALAGKLDVSLCVLTLSDKEMSDEEFMNRLAAVPKNSIILLEDIDVAIPSEKRRSELEVQKRRQEQQGQYNNYSGSLTMSGILNGIDGVTTADSQILIMTTNHKENLDSALIRAGRYEIK
jgi:chaperone BCS1